MFAFAQMSCFIAKFLSSQISANVPKFFTAGNLVNAHSAVQRSIKADLENVGIFRSI